MALFKIYNNIDSKNNLPSTHTKGYMYFDAVKKLFYIDLANDNDSATVKRVALNAWTSTNSENDGFITNPNDSHPQGQNIAATYIKNISISNDGDIILTKGNGATSTVDCSDLIPETAERLSHSLTFGSGAYVFDGSEDVTVPVYDGTYTLN